MSKQYSDETAARVRAVIRTALRDAPTKGRRHPAEVTADRLGDHLIRYGDDLDGATRDAFALVRHVLNAWATDTPA